MTPRLRFLYLLALALATALVLPAGALAAPGDTPGVTINVGEQAADPGTTLTILGLLTLITLAPSVLIMMTGFARILIVLGFLRNALGTQMMPPTQILVGFSLFLTLFVMAPTFSQVNERAVQPYLNEQIDAQQALKRAEGPMKTFMLKQTRASDLALFVKLSRAAAAQDARRDPPHDARAGLHDLGAQDRVPDRLPDLHPVPDRRPGRQLSADVDGDDDAATCDDQLAVQAAPLRAGGRLGPAHTGPGGRVPHVTEAFLQELATQAIVVTLKLSAPTLAVALGVGLLVSIFQAVTQIQEMTLTFIPKLFAVGLVTVDARAVDAEQPRDVHDRGVPADPGDVGVGSSTR